MRATPSSTPAVDFATLGPGVANLLAIYQAFDEFSDDTMRARFAGMRYGDLKKTVAEKTIEHIEPFQKRYHEMMADPAYLDGILKAGAERVQPIAGATVQFVKERMGLYTASH